MRFKNKNKKLAIILALSTISVATIGFAAWTITEISGIDDQQVTVQFGTVSSTSLKAESVDGSDLALNFDSNNNNQGPITGTGGEDMSFTIKFKVTKGENSPFVGVKFAITDGFDSIVTPNYIVRPYVTTAGGFTLNKVTAGTYYLASTSGSYETTQPQDGNFIQKHVVTGEGTTINFESTFTFKWGTEFGGKNPADYDNEPNATDATGKLNNFRKACDGINKQVSVNITPLAE